MVVDVVNESVNITYDESEVVVLTLDDNVLPDDNDLILNVLSVNGLSDENGANNTVNISTSASESTYDFITVVINTDDYAGETTWDVLDNSTDQFIASGNAGGQDFTEFTQQVCVNYESCFTLTVYDSFGDGICCAYGEGNFYALDAEGNQLVFNDGDFGSQGVEFFCPGDGGCNISAEIDITHDLNDDGAIAIWVDSGIGPYEYSIDGGNTFTDSNTFSDLTTGEYDVVVIGGLDNCQYSETVTLETCEFTNASIEATFVPSTVSTAGSISISPTSGEGPYQYSIDGGQTFIDEGEFLNLPVGNYNVVVQDGAGICEFEASVPIIVDTNLGLDENESLSNEIIVYPNPTRNMVTIEFKDFSGISEDVIIEVFDNLGRTINKGMMPQGGTGKTTIDLNEYESGTYFIRCSNTSFRESFMVMKI